MVTTRGLRNNLIIASGDGDQLEYLELLACDACTQTLEGIVINQYSKTAGVHRVMVEELVGEGLPVLPIYLSSSVMMRESHERCWPLFHLERRHKLTEQFVDLLHVWEEKQS